VCFLSPSDLVRNKFKEGFKVKRLKKVLKNQRGQGMLEYVLLLTIIVGLVMAFKDPITNIFKGATDNLTQTTGQVFNQGH
jgi:hypothetical protein